MTNHVVSLELSRQLWEKGIRVGSYIKHFCCSSATKVWWEAACDDTLVDFSEDSVTIDTLPAYTATELLAAMPRVIIYEEENYYISLLIDYESKDWFLNYESNISSLNFLIEDVLLDDNPANAPTKAVLYLLENGFIDANFRALQ